MSLTFAGEDSIGLATLRRLAESWPQRASIRRQLTSEQEDVGTYDPGLPDFPRHLVPFADHPLFLAATHEQRDRVLSGLWVGYNQRVIATEALVANPAFELLIAGSMPGSEDPVVRQTVQQSLIDESYHSYMHMMAVHRTTALRELGDRPRAPVLITYRRLAEVQAGLAEKWQQDLAVLVWGTVAETCINALLGLIARDRSIQPMHSLITSLHLRDESAHGSIMVEIMRRLWTRMDPPRRDLFTQLLPLALEAFSTQDPGAMLMELEHAGIRGAAEIVQDVGGSVPGRALVRDYSGAERLVRELGLAGQVQFAFPEPPDWARETMVDLEDLIS